MLSNARAKEPDPAKITMNISMPRDFLSVASTSITFSSGQKASFSDLSGLIEPEPVLLPPGALDDEKLIFSDHEDTEDGSHYGKYGAKAQPRQLSFDECNSDSEISEMFTRLLIDADRVTSGTGCHVQVRKLTTSKTRPFKTMLRHARD